jgi:hypothetical protein
MTAEKRDQGVERSYTITTRLEPSSGIKLYYQTLKALLYCRGRAAVAWDIFTGGPIMRDAFPLYFLGSCVHKTKITFHTLWSQE